ncbi:hypothetical protein C0J52_01694 [Blattella germanica]|nr:hypothetical protein C0J52_01694 [Blattella germanica]
MENHNRLDLFYTTIIIIQKHKIFCSVIILVDAWHLFTRGISLLKGNRTEITLNFFFTIK